MIDLQLFQKQALEELATVTGPAGLDTWKSARLGKKGPLQEILKDLAGLSPEERRDVGAKANAVKQELSAAWEARRASLANAAIAARLDAEWLDLSIPSSPVERGHLHPVTAVSRQIEDIFLRMGFQILEGPLVEDDWHNFEALNIPPSHPARDMQDTFFTTGGAVLRTHTSSVQIRAMERLKPPLRGIAPGRVFRCEDVDASHDSTFYQVEGLVIDRDITVAHMVHFLKTILREVFGREVEVRLRHGYFPFVEPGFEMDLGCLLCGGKGCPVCKHVGWMELLGCGLVHPKVLAACKIDPEEWSGFAFGMGLTRLAMSRHGMSDIRQLLGGDLRVSRQFG